MPAAQERAARIWQTIQEWNEPPGRPQLEEAAGHQASSSNGQQFDRYVGPLDKLPQIGADTLHQRIAAMPLNPNKDKPKSPASRTSATAAPGPAFHGLLATIPRERTGILAWANAAGATLQIPREQISYRLAFYRDQLAAAGVHLAQSTRYRALFVPTLGRIVCDFAFVRVTECRQGLPGPRLWLIIRRNLADPSEVKFYFSNAPEQIDVLELVQMSGMRWPVELSFEEAKSELGMDQYETRSWLGWHHHMLLVMLAHHFLVWVRVRWRERAPALTLSQVRLLLTSVIPKPLLNALRALKLVDYHQQRNHAAYLSHRKRKLAQLAAFDSAL